MLARFDDERPAIILAKTGKGSLYYLAAPLAISDYTMLLDLLAQKADLTRPVVGIGNDGRLVTRAEVRAVEREKDYLIYASNLTKDTVGFDIIKGMAGFGSKIDLRNMTELNTSHIVLQPWQESLFRFDKQ